MRLFRSAVFALAFLASAAHASEDRVPAGPSALERADLVATAEVVSARAVAPSKGDRLLFTELEVRVRECVKGSCPGSMKVRVPGGRFGGYEQIVEDHPVPSPGEIIAV